MKLILVRHAAAADPDEFARTGQPDELRPLTEEGRLDLRQGARGLRMLVDRLDVIATSPLTRAFQTAEIVRKEYEDVPLIVVESLRPQRPFSEFLAWLSQLGDAAAVAVGHDPHLGALAWWLLSGTSDTLVEMKKGSALMLEFGAREVQAGGARLRWFLTPAQLRALAPRVRD